MSDQTGRSSSAARYLLGVVIASLVALLAWDSAALSEWIDWHLFGRKEVLRLGAYEGDVAALEWIAAERGFFEGVGLEVEMKGFASGKAASDALRAGAIDVATASEYVVVTRSFAEPDLRVFGSISYYRNKAIVARRDLGIDQAADLKDKRIGVTQPSSAEYSLNVFLAIHGLDNDDVTLVNLAPDKIVGALVDGAVDAAITWEPHVRKIQEALGARGVTFEGKDFDAYLLLLGRQEYVDGHSRALRKLLQALVRAEDWVRANPAEAKRLLAARFSLDAAYLDALWPRLWLEVRLPQELLATMDGQARWLAKEGRTQTATIPNFASFLRPDELKAVRPSAMTLFAETRSVGAVGSSGSVVER